MDAATLARFLGIARSLGVSDSTVFECVKAWAA